MEKINEIFAEQELSPVDSVFLDTLFPKLVSMGFSPVRTNTGTLCVELNAFGETYALAHIVSAREVFYLDEHVTATPDRTQWPLYKQLLRKFQRKQNLWVEEDDKAHKAVNKLLLIVDVDNLPSGEQFALLRMEVEHDLYVAKKVMCTMATLRAALCSPFKPVAHRAHAEPDLSLAAGNESAVQPFSIDAAQ